ncbi:MAG: nodulation protein NfeD [Dehalococcoidia bacterium]
MTAFGSVSFSPIRSLRLTIAAVLIILGVVGFACAGGLGAPPDAVHVLTADGVVGPVMERYLDRGIDAAEDEEGAAVVIRLDTPGGLLSSTRDIVQRILGAEIPIAVYVSPPGARAASAGTFITAAANFAVMAPGTNIGAASPVASGGEDVPTTLEKKIEEDTRALIRSIADVRGRNSQALEETVTEARAYTAREAVEKNIVDFVAGDLDELLDSIDGRQVTLGSGREVTLQTANADQVFNNMNFIERFLDLIADPNIALLLLSLGSLAIFIEIVNPGVIFPGVFGVIALLLGFFSLSVIPFNWAGVALIIFAFILFGLEIFVPSGGILGGGGVVALILGGLLLTSGNPPEFQVSRWLLIGLATAMGAMVVFVLVNIVRIRMMPVQVGVETLVGHEAVARSVLDPEGFVFLEGEIWSAESEEGAIQSGERVVITEVQGLRLKVRKQQQQQQPEGD